MSDLSGLKLRIDELKGELAQHRSTGRTSRLVNDYIEKFFNEPRATWIEVRDHYWGRNIGGVDGKMYIDTSHHEYGSPEMRRSVEIANKLLMEKIVKRLKSEYPYETFELNMRDYPYKIMRTSFTFKERTEMEIESLQKLLDKEAAEIKKDLERKLNESGK